MLLRYLKVASLVGLGVAAGAAPVLAAPPHMMETQSVLVRFGDVDLSSTAGAEQLYRRLERAARDVCSEDDWSTRRKLWLQQGIEECKARAIDDAVARVNSPALTDLHLLRESENG
jgi:UrcA family protein